MAGYNLDKFKGVMWLRWKISIMLSMGYHPPGKMRGMGERVNIESGFIPGKHFGQVV